jgi:hypothetical protein
MTMRFILLGLLVVVVMLWRSTGLSNVQDIVLLLFLVLYMFPTILASIRQHHNTTAIMALNVLLGWTFLGWVAAFVWACTNPSTVRVV